jgi:NAD(P)-dependent dehydrogenase (short-subunit alcohol dehydrogenase family)
MASAGSDPTHRPPTDDRPVGPDTVLLTGRVAVVTGAAQGIGAATARALARFGAHVVVVDRKPEGLSETVAAVEAEGRTCIAVEGDVRDPEVVSRVVGAAVEAHGRIDVLVNNAGGGFWAPFADVSAKGEAALIAENFTQVTNFIRDVLPHMHGGSIVNITSIEGHRAGPGFGIYSAMKAGVENLSKTLALELAPRGIRVNCVAPDMIPTPGDAGLAEDSGALLDGAYHPSPMGRMGSTEDAAAAVVFLAGDMARFVTGTTLHLDGGTFAASGWRRRTSDDGWGL